MIKASAQMLVQAIGRAQRCQEDRLALEKQKADNAKFAQLVVETDNKWKKDLDTLKADFAAVNEQYEDSVQHRNLLNSENDKLRKEKEEMQLLIDSLEIEQAEAWAPHRKAVKDEGFQEGFDYYLLAFMAREPDYDWSKWGQECAEDMAKYRVERAEDIRKKKIELGLEKDVGAAYSPGGGILNDDEVANADPVSTLIAQTSEVPPPETSRAVSSPAKSPQV